MSMNDSRLKPNTARLSDQTSVSSGPRWRMQCWASRTAGDRRRRRPGRRRWRSRRAGHTSGAGPRGGGEGGRGRVRRARRRASSAWRCARRRRTGTGWCRPGCVSAGALRASTWPAAPGRRRSRKNRAYSQPCAVPRTTTGPGMSAKYFSGTATQMSSDQQDADDVRHHPVALQRRRDRLLGVAGRRSSGQRPWVLLRCPSAAR